jgi:hypothetical protein
LGRLSDKKYVALNVASKATAGNHKKPQMENQVKPKDKKNHAIA